MEKSNQLANSLVKDYGIKKGDKVAFSMRNYPEWMFTYIAVTSIGAIAVPLNSWWKGDELEYGLDNSESKLFIADEERLDRVKNILPSLPRIAVRSSKPEYADIAFELAILILPQLENSGHDGLILILVCMMIRVHDIQHVLLHELCIIFYAHHSVTVTGFPGCV